MSITVEMRKLSTGWLAVIRRDGIWMAQAQAPSEREVNQLIYRILREMRDGIDAALKEM